MKKPIIGILGAHMSNNGGPAPVPADYVNHAYCAGVENAGGIPVLGFSQRKCKDRKTGRHGSGDGQVGIGCGRGFAFYRESLRTV